ncbi:hypothetical protein HDU97_008442 [Phlyctochytrium planicorne]|nr:hypothetical protein HDU97_008442 [Phlyctochytrium planicorne]
MSTLPQIPFPSITTDWEKQWEESKTGWDLGASIPGFKNALDELLQNQLAGRKDLMALVPGCGRGYDVIEFAKRGVEAVGLDLADTGVKEAIKYRNSQNVSEALAKFQTADFFKWTPAAKFDIVYDQTFLCALDKHLRPSWSTKISQITAPGGYLICMMFPLRPDDEKGPPFSLSDQIYKDLLEKDFEEIYTREFRSDERPERDVSAIGAAKMALWRRKTGGSKIGAEL